MTKKSANEVMPVRSSTLMSDAFLDSAARTAMSQVGVAGCSGFSFLRTRSCSYRTICAAAMRSLHNPFNKVYTPRIRGGGDASLEADSAGVWRGRAADGGLRTHAPGKRDGAGGEGIPEFADAAGTGAVAVSVCQRR